MTENYGIQNAAGNWFTGFDRDGNPLFGSKEAAQGFVKHWAEAQAHLLNRYCASHLTTAPKP